MKPTARILRLKGKELRTSAEITAAEEALMADLIAGEITPAESRRIQRELTEKIKGLASALKTASQLTVLNELADKLERIERKGVK